MDVLIETLGPRAVAYILIAVGVFSLAQPVYAARARDGWTRVRGRVIEIPQRRSLASTTWAVLVRFTTPDGASHDAIAPINITKTPLAPGDPVEIMHHPDNPNRTAVTRWQGASTGIMVAGLCFLGATGLLGGA